MRLIDADALRAEYQAILDRGDMFCEYDIVGMVDDAPTIKPTITCKECDGYEAGYSAGQHDARPKGERIITGEEQGALGITYKKRKCDQCGWEHSLIIPNNFCPKCGADMRVKGGEE